MGFKKWISPNPVTTNIRQQNQEQGGEGLLFIALSVATYSIFLCMQTSPVSFNSMRVLCHAMLRHVTRQGGCVTAVYGMLMECEAGPPFLPALADPVIVCTGNSLVPGMACGGGGSGGE